MNRPIDFLTAVAVSYSAGIDFIDQNPHDYAGCMLVTNMVEATEFIYKRTTYNQYALNGISDDRCLITFNHMVTLEAQYER